MGQLMDTTTTQIYEEQECICVEYGHNPQVEKPMETATQVPPFLRSNREDNVARVLSVLSRHRYIFFRVAKQAYWLQHSMYTHNIITNHNHILCSLSNVL